MSDLQIEVDDPQRLHGQRVLVIEDGPTVTHGGMAFGAGIVAAERYGATAVDPRPYAVGTIRDTFTAYPHLERVLPAMGYSEAQREALRTTINACCRKEQVACVLDASPARLDRLMELAVPLVRVRYRFEQLDGPALERLVAKLL
jgi:predicted GTPase